jgi:hypothetical protein
MNAQLIMTCGRCRAPIDGGSGFIGVRYRELAPAEVLRKAGNFPDEVIWEALHNACDPNPAAACYAISADRIATWPAVAWWTAHLLAKPWIDLTDWDEVLRELAGEGGSPRIAVRMESAA